MRARKRNPWWGQGLDKRQARRARRRTERRVARVEAFMDEVMPDFKLMPWQREVLRATQATAAIVRPRTPARPLLSELVYDPRPAGPLLPEPGVTSGYIVMRNGVGSDALVAKAAMLTDDEGVATFEVLSAFTPTQVVDDAEGES